MDAPNSSSEAAQTAETSTGPVSDSPAATRPSSAFDQNQRSADALHAPRPTQIRSGAIAAACAIAVVIGVTAVPSTQSSPSSASAGYAPVATLVLENLPMEGGLPALDLGADIGAFTIPGRPSWKDYEGGDAVLAVWFRSVTIADAVFAGEIRLSNPVDGGVSSGQTASTSFDVGAGYAQVEGELFGRGALDGVMLRVEGASGAMARRGSWQGPDGETVQDAVFARFTWTSEGEAAREIDVPSKGTGALAFKLRPVGRE